MTSSNRSPAQVLAACSQNVYEKRLSVGTSGNISMREEGDRIYITPSGLSLEETTAENVVVMNLMNGEKLCGEGKPSSEWPMHRALYLARPDIHAIIHAHPAKATALAAAHQTIDQHLIAEGVFHLGEVPLVPYLLPGSDALAQSIVDCGKVAQVMLLANHGVIAMGGTIREAFYHLELVESLAEVYILANSLPGGPKPLSESQVQEILALKQK